jgi:hypothetical protein
VPLKGERGTLAMFICDDCVHDPRELMRLGMNIFWPSGPHAAPPEHPAARNRRPCKALIDGFRGPIFMGHLCFSIIRARQVSAQLSDTNTPISKLRASRRLRVP